MLGESGEFSRPENDRSKTDNLEAGWLELLASRPGVDWDSEPRTPDRDKEASPEETGPKKVASGNECSKPGKRTTHAEELSSVTTSLAPAADPDLRAESAALTNERALLVSSILEDDTQNGKTSSQAASVRDSKSIAPLIGDSERSASSDSARSNGTSTVVEQTNCNLEQKDRRPQEADDTFNPLPYGLMWLDDMEESLDTNMNPQENDEKQPANEVDDFVADPGAQEPDDATPEASLNPELEQVPDDPDEAIAWLERLAARQGAPAEELPTVPSSFPDLPDAAEAEDDFDPGEMDAGEIPEDPDEAMAWLEMLAAREGANTSRPEAKGSSGEPEEALDVEIGVVEELEPEASPLAAELDEAIEESLPSGLDEALGWLEELTTAPTGEEEVTAVDEVSAVVEEPPTPAVAHDVAAALAGAEQLFAEPEAAEEMAGVDQQADELQYDEAEDAMAWLEQLAARQGAPLEELTTIDSEPEDQAPETIEIEAPALEESDSAVTLAEEALPVVAEVDTEEGLEEPSAADEQLEPEASELEGAQPVEAQQEVFEEAESGEVLAVELSAITADADGQTAADQIADERPIVEEVELEIAAEAETPAEDLAWLDTLGAVDAERWLEAEDADVEEEIASKLPEARYDEQVTSDDMPLEIPPALFVTAPMLPGSEALVEARQAYENGDMHNSLDRYASLVEEGELLSFLIDDLETISAQREPDPALQQVLGDAYARNGQLRKALESYRGALANL